MRVAEEAGTKVAICFVGWRRGGVDVDATNECARIPVVDSPLCSF